MVNIYLYPDDSKNSEDLPLSELKNKTRDILGIEASYYNSEIVSAISKLIDIDLNNEDVIENLFNGERTVVVQSGKLLFDKLKYYLPEYQQEYDKFSEENFEIAMLYFNQVFNKLISKTVVTDEQAFLDHYSNAMLRDIETKKETTKVELHNYFDRKLLQVRDYLEENKRKDIKVLICIK